MNNRQHTTKKKRSRGAPHFYTKHNVLYVLYFSFCRVENEKAEDYMMKVNGWQA